MLKLTKHQGRVGSVLQEGNRLLHEGQLSPDEERETEIQMGLLNNRWEDVRIRAMDRQGRY